MDKQSLWETFAQTGNISDYLTYRGINADSIKTQEAKAVVADHRRADHSGTKRK